MSILLFASFYDRKKNIWKFIKRRSGWRRQSFKTRQKLNASDLAYSKRDKKDPLLHLWTLRTRRASMVVVLRTTFTSTASVRSGTKLTMKMMRCTSQKKCTTASSRSSSSVNSSLRTWSNSCSSEIKCVTSFRTNLSCSRRNLRKRSRRQNGKRLDLSRVASNAINLTGRNLRTGKRS